MQGSILILNSGSSSLKYEVFSYGEGSPLKHTDGGLIEKIGENGSGIASHAEALSLLMKERMPPSLSGELVGIGHRVVHGGEQFDRAVLVNSDVLEGIRATVSLAPLHNPANLAGIEACSRFWPEIPQVAVFDTAFHQTLPESAWRYAIRDTPDQAGRIRRYGFHGTSFSSVRRQVAAYLGRDSQDLSLIVLHLGNGASACAIRDGISVDTSMGMTPTAGLVMGTRSGDIDPGILLHWLREEDQDAVTLDQRLNRESGLFGLCGTNDMRELLKAIEGGCQQSAMALSVYVHRIRHYIGAYRADLPDLDALVFTGGVGQHASMVRARVLEDLSHLGFMLDEALNASDLKGILEIQRQDSPVRILVVPALEEREIAIQVCEALGWALDEWRGA
mgnify:FL=1